MPAYIKTLKNSNDDSIYPITTASAVYGSDNKTVQQTLDDVAATYLKKAGDSSNTTVDFTPANTREEIATGNKLSVLFGKISKWFSELKTIAFTGNYNDLSNKPLSLPANGGNADTLCGIEAGGFIINGDTILNTNPFGGKKLYINSIDDAMWAADKKWFVSATLHSKVVSGVTYPKAINTADITLPQWEDSPVVSTASSEQINSLFSNNYEGGITIPIGQYLKVAIDFSQDKQAYFTGYPYGTYYLNYYDTNTPNNAQVRCYNGYALHTVGYKTLNFTDFWGAKNTSQYVQQCEDGGNFHRRNLEFVVFSSDDHITILTEINWKLSRPDFSRDSPILAKYGNNKSYFNMTFGTQTADKVIITSSGGITAETVTANMTSSTATFADATERSNINTNETFAVMLGKIKKWFSDFGSLAFKNKVDAVDLPVGTVIDANYSASVWIKKTAAAATSVADKNKFLIDTSDNNILKVWDSSLATPAWVPVSVAWGT
ncbi:MAG: hypothetical protein RR365_00875 [Bacteroides sp.]